MENIAQADALLVGRVTYEIMEAAWRFATRTVALPESMRIPVGFRNVSTNVDLPAPFGPAMTTRSRSSARFSDAIQSNRRNRATLQVFGARSERLMKR
jgi:hypothetical protein